MTPELVSPLEARAIWPDVQGFFEDALGEYDAGFSIEQVEEAVYLGAYDLWTMGKDGACLTMVLTLPQYKTLYLWMWGGAKLDWLQPMLNVLEDYARVCGCRYVDTGGRIGWTKLIKRMGYEVSVQGRKRVDECLA